VRGSAGRDQLIVYDGSNNRGWGPAAWLDMFREARESRELIWRLFLRDFTARYKETVLGLAWAVIMPVIAVGSFIFLNRTGVLNVGEVEVPYPAYALLGLTIWQVFAGGLVSCSEAIMAGGSMVSKINFPKESLVIAAFGQALADMLVRLLLVIAVFAYYRLMPPLASLLFPLALIPIMLFTLGLGLGLSLLNALMRDVANIVTIATTFLLFLTPVLYAPPRSGAFALLSRYNPLAALVTGPRDLVLKGYLSDPGGFALAGVLAAVVFILSWRLFHLAETRIAERIGAR